MSLIVEDGSALANAESLCSVAAADLYHINIGNESTWFFLSNAVKEQCLRKATAYMESYYRDRYAGFRKTTTQALCWPRGMVPIKDAPGNYGRLPAFYDQNSVPSQVANACASLALRVNTAELTPDLDRETVSESVGGISVSYRSGARQHIMFREIDLLLSPFMSDAGTQLVRA